jgi:hypothetical protein
MTDDPSGETRHIPATVREDWELHVFTQAYQALASTGDACRILCQDHPDLMDQIAKAIMTFFYDGDVFDQIAREMLSNEPDYWGLRLSEIEPDVARRIIGQILGD